MCCLFADHTMSSSPSQKQPAPAAPTKSKRRRARRPKRRSADVPKASVDVGDSAAAAAIASSGAAGDSAVTIGNTEVKAKSKPEQNPLADLKQRMRAVQRILNHLPTSTGIATVNSPCRRSSASPIAATTSNIQQTRIRARCCRQCVRQRPSARARTLSWTKRSVTASARQFQSSVLADSQGPPDRRSRALDPTRLDKRSTIVKDERCSRSNLIPSKCRDVLR